MAASPPPVAVRAGPAQGSLDYTDVVRPGARSAILDRMSGEAREAFETSVRTAWIPVELDREFLEAALAEMGRAEMRRCWAASVPRQLQTPLLRTFFDGVRAMFGLSVADLLRYAAKAWPLVYRGFGTPSLACGEGWVAFRLDGVPPTVLGSEAYRIALQGTMDGLLELYERPPECSVGVDTSLARLDLRAPA